MANSEAASELEVGRDVLRQEATGILRLADSLDGRFLQAVEILAAVVGRTVVTGMGKSGHVARKIAATMASTGQPALFVHPGEASHGDLGMITPADAVLALSNSGETAELANIVDYAGRFAIPLIAVVGREGSALAEAARVALVLPQMAEACPMGLAPTTSTTMMLALGDALSVALLRRRGFSAADFSVFHPGGKLGRRLVKVQDIMHRGAAMPLAPEGTPMGQALITMTEKAFGCVGVVDAAGHLIGIVTDGDLRRHMAPGLLALPVEAVMTGRPLTIRPGALAAEALHLLNARRITALFAVEDRCPVGVFNVHDCLRAGVA
ncbi:MAG: KpsF/GutQ family sugar-phosphate isomerase [Alphaproteobacteria bacterium]|nr:KpsF/GutQ family sugar-phosphate isomerase [Alphaproteobacteria bacterium]